MDGLFEKTSVIQGGYMKRLQWWKWESILFRTLQLPWKCIPLSVFGSLLHLKYNTLQGLFRPCASAACDGITVNHISWILIPWLVLFKQKFWEVPFWLSDRCKSDICFLQIRNKIQGTKYICNAFLKCLNFWLLGGCVLFLKWQDVSEWWCETQNTHSVSRFSSCLVGSFG